MKNNGDNIKNDLLELKLAGKVKSLLETTFVEELRYIISENSKLELTPIRCKNNFLQKGDMDILFNDQGNKIEENIYYSKGSLYSKRILKYDNNQNIIEENIYNYLPNGNLDGQYTSKFYNKYDDKGNIVEQCGCNSDNNLNKNTSYMYDDKRNLIEKNWYETDDGLGRKDTWKYDGKGNVIENIWYKSNGSIVKKWIYKYDDKKNIIEEIIYNSNSNSDYTLYYKYDDKGNEIEVNTYSLDEDLRTKHTCQSYNYNYDETGNWTKRTEFENAITIEITAREIEYYL